jgi:hypothetical protein
MLKKFFILYIICAILSVVLYACTCKEQGNHQTVDNTYIDWNRSIENTPNDSTITGDTMYLHFGFNSHCVAQVAPITEPFISAALASKKKICPCGQDGFRVPITGLIITSDSIYGSFPAGADVTSLFGAYALSLNSYGGYNIIYYSPADFPQLLSQSMLDHSEEGISGGDIHLFVAHKPGDNKMHSFTVRLSSTDSTWSAVSPHFRWQ